MPQLKLRTIGVRDYAVLEGEQHIGRIRFAAERTPGVWLWNVTVHLTGGLPSAKVPARFRSPPRMEAHLSRNERISWSLNGFIR